MAFYHSGKIFSSLHQCGRKSSLELERLCQDLQNNNQFPDRVKSGNQNPDVNVLVGLNDFEVNALFEIFQFEISILSVRSKNGIQVLYKKNHKSFRLLMNRIHSLEYDFTKIKGLGKGSNDELQPVFKKIKNLISRLKNDSTFSILPISVSVRLSNYLNRANFGYQKILLYFETKGFNDFPVFHFLQFLLDEFLLFDERKTKILKYHSGYFLYERHTLEQLSEIFGVTRERVRQLALPENLLTPLWDKINNIIEKIPSQPLDRYEIDYNSPIIVLDDEKINEIDETYFNEYFIYKGAQLRFVPIGE